MFHVRKLGLITAILATTLSVALPPAAAFAQASTSTTTKPPLNLTTSPIPLSIVTEPGKTVTADIRVKNNSVRTEKLKIELLKFGADGTTGNPQLHEREAKDTYFDWVSFSEQTFDAEPNVWKTIKMTIKTPPSAAFGYYLAVLFSRATPDKPPGGASAVEGGVASLVLLDVEAPGAKREAKVASLTATRKVYEFLPADLKVRLSNSGNVHVAPTGSVFIKRGAKQVAVLDFNTQRGNILPGSSRDFEVSWADGFPAYVEKKNENKTERTLKWDFSKVQKLRFGRYTATLVAVYDDGQRDVPVEATVSFWVIPWRILGVIFLIGLLIAAGVWMVLHSIWKKVRRRPPPASGTPDDKDVDSPTDVSTDNSSSRAETSESGSTEPVPPVTVPQKEEAAAPSIESEPAKDQSSAPVVPAKTNEPDVPKTAPEIKD